MAQIKWQFSGNQIYAYEKSIFENTVKALIQRVKPKGFRILNLDFAEKSESVYVVLVSLHTTEYLQFRISSHGTFGKRIYKTYNTNDFTGFVTLEKHIENELKQAAGSKKQRLESKITFHYQEEDFLFFRKLGYLHNIKKRFLMVETELVKQGLESIGKKALLVDEYNQVKGTIIDGGLIGEVFSMVAKGFLTAHPISKEFSLIGTTKLYRNLSHHYGLKFSEAAAAMDMADYFSNRLLHTNLPLRGTELWPFENTYHLGHMAEDIKAFLERRPAQLGGFTAKGKSVEAVLIRGGHYMRLHLTPAQTANYKDLLQLKNDLRHRTNGLDHYDAFTFEDYLIVKLLRKLKQEGRTLLMPKPLPNGLEIWGEEPKALMKNILKATEQGLAEFGESIGEMPKLPVAPTDFANQLFEVTRAKYEPLFLKGLKEGTLGEDFVHAYGLNPYEFLIQGAKKACHFLKHLKFWLGLFKTKKPQLVAFVAPSKKSWEPGDMPGICQQLGRRLASVVPEGLTLLRLEAGKNSVEAAFASTTNRLDFIHFTISANQCPTMMKLFRSDKMASFEDLLEAVGAYLGRVVAEQGHYRHFKYSDYEVCRIFHNLKRAKKMLKVKLVPEDFHLTKLTACDLILEGEQSFILRLNQPKIMGQIRYGLLNGLIKLIPLEGDTYAIDTTLTATVLADDFVGMVQEESIEDHLGLSESWERFKLKLGRH